MRKEIFFILAITLLLYSCQKKWGKDDNTCSSNKDAMTLLYDGQNREYLIYVPTTYNENISVPLLFNFHGFGGNATEFMNYADMRTLAESDTFLLVYPQGTCLNGYSHWNPSLPSANNKSHADDLGFIEALINNISSDYNIDAARIYACGYSNGAMMAYGLARHKSSLIAAIGSVSGIMLDTDTLPEHPTSLIDIHGTSDGVLSYNGNSDYNSVDNVLDFWINLNHCNTTPQVNSFIDKGMTIEHYEYLEGDNGTAVEHYKIIGGEHVWFDNNFQGKDTGRLIWDFVSQFDIHGKR